MNREKLINTATVCLLLCLLGAGFMVMNKTAESNKVTADIAVIQSKHKKAVLIQVGLLTAEMKNLQKDMTYIREKVDAISKENIPPIGSRWQKKSEKKIKVAP